MLSDRFIVNRSVLNIEQSNFMLLNEKNNIGVIHGKMGITKEQRILNFNDKKQNETEDVEKINSIKKLNNFKDKKIRTVLKKSIKTLDAPNVFNDYYLNLLDWDSGDNLMVGLENEVYIYDNKTREVAVLTKSQTDNVTSVKFNKHNNNAVVAWSNGICDILDYSTQKTFLKLEGDSSRMNSISWNNPNILSVGTTSSSIFTYDIRKSKPLISTSICNNGELAGLEWSYDGRNLASGGNEGTICIWDSHMMLTPKIINNFHKASVKALSWCPWNNNILASGGGLSDGRIQIYNVSNETISNQISTGSQISSLKWNKVYNELISSHGFNNTNGSIGEINIWCSRNLSNVCKLTGHSNRILSMCQNKNHSTVATLSADETVKFWKVTDGYDESKEGVASNVISKGKFLTLR